MAKAIATVRDWLSTASGGKPLPGGARIAGRFAQFTGELPAIAAACYLEAARADLQELRQLRRRVAEQRGRSARHDPLT